MSFIAPNIVYKQNSIVNSVRVDDWTAEWANITINAIYWND